MDNLKKLSRWVFNWFLSLFQTRYKVTVSFNKEYGDSDDRTFITKKILVQKEKHLKFRDEDDRVIEYRSASGLNYIIEDV
jgi:phage-related protein|tara:strand:- start:652 stop:891 length:240 start_codon:yes stop_codon:yes gene_type:complete